MGKEGIFLREDIMEKGLCLKWINRFFVKGRYLYMIWGKDILLGIKGRNVFIKWYKRIL